MIKFVIRGFLLLFDKGLNVLLLGSPHRTISMRLSIAVYCRYVRPRYSWVVPFAKLVDVLFHNKYYTLEESHIYNSYEADEILSKDLWDWFIVVDQEGYDNIAKEVERIRFQGRDKDVHIPTA